MDSKPQAYSHQVKELRVPDDREGQRLDNFLARHLKGLPRAALYRLIRTGQVRVNGGRAKPDRKLSAGDAIRVPPVEYREPGDATVSQAVGEQIEQAILFEDEDLIVVDKPSGIAVHAGSGLAWGLIDAVRQIRPGKRIELVHRIDRETSGCLVLACSAQALQSLAEQFREGQVTKRYLCLLAGELKQAVVVVDEPIAATRRGGEKHMSVDEDGRNAITRFTQLERYAEATYARAEILTGRTHQIRVHAHHIGAPLAGDRKYGTRQQAKSWSHRGLKRLFLHAAELTLTAPSGEEIGFDAPLPPELRACLDGLTPIS
jgi:23S rRNA pseudouridine955/2504/2580 synthase